MKNKILLKTFIIVLLVLFVGVAFTPIILGDYNKDIANANLTFYTFNKTKTNKCEVILPTDTAKNIYNLFEELKSKIVNDFKSDETQLLKKNFIEILDVNGLIPKVISKEYVYLLLNPKWLSYVNIPGTSIKNNIIPGPFSDTGSVFICSIAGGGRGLLFMPIMAPRPRFVTIWTSLINAQSMAANLLTGWGFIASGQQNGIALGFIGIGISFAIPGEPASFGFGGYALAAFVGAENVQNYPIL
ncbi:MAG: hypothetical protein AYK22_00165 [Thermoplasmatales archaeon SG8-52-3]|nr:MAG: hypothetical protein AYK22_00165 [Thermoplasmatales archaeon SG8-52-3]